MGKISIFYFLKIMTYRFFGVHFENYINTSNWGFRLGQCNLRPDRLTTLRIVLGIPPAMQNSLKKKIRALNPQKPVPRLLLYKFAKT